MRHEGMSLLIKRKHYRNLCIGSVVSGFGDQLGSAALMWMALKVTGSPAAIGLVAFCFRIPRAFLSPVAGVLGDRFARAKLMAFGNVVLALVFGSLGLVSGWGPHLFWITFPLLVIGGIFLPLTSTGRSQIIAHILPKEELVTGNFFDDIYLQITWLIGPAIGGLLISWMGFEPVLVLDSVSFLVCALCVMKIPSDFHSADIGVRGLTRNFIEGVRYLFTHKVLIYLAVISFFFNLFYGVYTVAIPIMANRYFGGATAYGVLWSSFAVGSLLGGFFLSSRKWKWKVAASMASVIVLWGLFTIAFSFVTNYGLAITLMVVNGLAFTPYGPLYNTLVQRLVPIKLQAKVTGAVAPITGLGQPVGDWLSGVTVAFTGLEGLLLMSGVATLAVGISAVALPVLRAFDRSNNELTAS